VTGYRPADRHRRADAALEALCEARAQAKAAADCLDACATDGTTADAEFVAFEIRTVLAKLVALREHAAALVVRWMPDPEGGETDEPSPELYSNQPTGR